MDETTRAYIAGFLDGDGSILFQIVRRQDYIFGYQIRVSVCFYQNIRSKAGLEWLKEQLVAGYIRDRAGCMSDYTIVGCSEVKRVLQFVRPYALFKKAQVEQALDLIERLERRLTPQEFLAVSHSVDSFATLNYSKKKFLDAHCVEKYLESKGLLVPVTTEALCRDRL